MSIAPRLKWYLDHCGVDYEILPHLHTASSLETARVARVPPSHLAKAVLLEDESGYLMAIIPASKRVDIPRLSEQLHRDLSLANEQDLGAVFGDCEPGALPVTGSPYRIPTVYDDCLQGLEDVYFEAGDHEDVVHMTGDDFEVLVADSLHGRFTRVS
ncbi:MAG: YbaK/EbsC family protein [Myxococcota bacterium]|nr:YbaK/EbsC family protein [Myxococcota bacterium]